MTVATHKEIVIFSVMFFFSVVFLKLKTFTLSIMLYNQNKTIKIRLSEEVKITTLISFSQCTYRTVTQFKILRVGNAVS